MKHCESVTTSGNTFRKCFCKSKTCVVSGRRPVINEVREGEHSGNWQ